MGVMTKLLRHNIGSQSFSAKGQNDIISSSVDSFVSQEAVEQRLWLSVRDVARRYSCGRSTIYGWIATGAVRSVSLRRRGNIRGLRRIYAPSVDSLFASAEQKPGRFGESSSHNGRAIVGH
jgi:hypothetical protein